MLSNYLKIALNNFFRHRLFAVINILGLAIGLACCLVIALYVRYELSFDEHYRHAARVVRIDQVIGDAANYRTPGLLSHALTTEVLGIEEAARFINVEATLSFENLTFNESAFAYADARFLEIFDFQWLKGSPQQALNDPGSVVLTQSLAAKYFGNEDPLGKVLRTGEYSLRVTGVIVDLPSNTHLRFSALASMELFAGGLRSIGFDLDGWNSSFVSTYALLAEDVEVSSIRSQLPGVVTKHMQPGISLNVLPLADIYLHAQAQMELSPVGSMPRVLIFSAIALCILAVAIINFINLSTARASWRALEVGLRKSLGASRAQIIRQFLGESVVLVVCAMLLGLMVVEILLPVVNAVTGKTFVVDFWTDPAALAGLLAFTLGLGLLAGFYPAFYLSAFHPVAVLKGEITRGRQGGHLRSLLVIAQFSLSIAMIIAAGVIYLQIQYVRDVDMGFDYEQVVLLDVPTADIFDANNQWEALSAQLNNHPGVIGSTHSVSTPLTQGAKTAAFIYREEEGARVPTQDRFVLEIVEPAYLATYGLELLSGRWFSASLQSDRLATFAPGYQGNPQGSLILNAEAARQLGWSADEAVGQVLGIGTINRGVVTGVVSNTVASPRQSYQPLVYYVPEQFDYRFGATIAVKIAGTNVPQTLDHIDATWNAFFPDNPVQRYFLEDQVGALYQQETQQMQLAVLSAVVAVLIACFGLYALAAFNAEHRSKEIGVRKVMGGSVWSIVLLLTSDFSRLVLLSNLIAWPAAYFAMSRWLENFAYRIDLTPLIFIGSGLIALCIAWVTVGCTAAKAASAKPVLALRYE